MPCAPCAAQSRAELHRRAVQAQAQRPFALPADVVVPVQASIRAWRRALLDARAWLDTQPRGRRRLATLQLLQQWTNRLLEAEQQLLRAGVAE